MFGRFKLSVTKKAKKKPKNTQYFIHKEAARKLIAGRLEYYNQFYNLTYHRVAIKDQRRCWGSCSSKGNLNFSYKLLFLPACLRDYVILHELCHLRVLNHSADFWNTMAPVMPDYKERAIALRHIEQTEGTAVRSLLKVSAGHMCVACSAVALPALPREVKESMERSVLTAY
jgi:predicted metal-dependent hydrolase